MTFQKKRVWMSNKQTLAHINIARSNRDKVSELKSHVGDLSKSTCYEIAQYRRFDTRWRVSHAIKKCLHIYIVNSIIILGLDSPGQLFSYILSDTLLGLCWCARVVLPWRSLAPFDAIKTPPGIRSPLFIPVTGSMWKTTCTIESENRSTGSGGYSLVA